MNVFPHCTKQIANGEGQNILTTTDNATVPRCQRRRTDRGTTGALRLPNCVPGNILTCDRPPVLHTYRFAFPRRISPERLGKLASLLSAHERFSRLQNLRTNLLRWNTIEGKCLASYFETKKKSGSRMSIIHNHVYMCKITGASNSFLFN